MLNKETKTREPVWKQVDFQVVLAIQFILALLVVLLHSHNLAGYPNASGFEKTFVNFFSHGVCTAAVPIFFALSGFLFFRDIGEQDFGKIKDKILKRVKTVLVPFLLWSAIYYIFYAVCNRVLHVSMEQPVDVSPLGIIKGIAFYRYCFPLWYMAQLFVYMLLTPLIYLTLKRKWVFALVFISLFVLHFTGYGEVRVQSFGIDRSLFSSNFFLYFYVGCMFARTDGHRWKIKVPKSVLFLALLLVSGLSAAVYEGVIGFGEKRICIPLVALCMLVFLYKLFKNEKVLKSVNAVAKNCNSMLIYTLHPLMGILPGYVVPRSIGVIPHFILRFLLTSIVTCLVAFLLKKYFKFLYRFLGGR